MYCTCTEASHVLHVVVLVPVVRVCMNMNVLTCMYVYVLHVMYVPGTLRVVCTTRVVHVKLHVYY